MLCHAAEDADSDRGAAGEGRHGDRRARAEAQGLGFRVEGLGFRVWGLGFRVSLGLMKDSSPKP